MIIGLDEFASEITKFDPTADSWIYNKYCKSCGRFLYFDDLIKKACKKCKSKTSSVVRRPIPLLTSATATEKLIEWVKMRTAIIGDEWQPIFSEILDETVLLTGKWMTTDMKADKYRRLLVDLTYNRLIRNEKNSTSKQVKTHYS